MTREEKLLISVGLGAIGFALLPSDLRAQLAHVAAKVLDDAVRLAAAKRLPAAPASDEDDAIDIDVSDLTVH